MNINDQVSILIVDDHRETLFTHQYRVSTIFKNLDKGLLNIKTATTVAEMLHLIKEEVFHVILLDKDLGKKPNGERIDGIDEIPNILEISPRSKVLVITASEDVDAAVKAMKFGAIGYVSKNPSQENQLYCDQQILGALKAAKTELELLAQKSAVNTGLGTYIVKSKAMTEFDFKLKALASVNTPVLILGESGLGKTHAARRLSELTKEANRQTQRPFINVNINSIPKTLIESELFGSEKGSFTSSNERKQGLFEAAAGGDLFLDEIGDASLELQGSLLKVIEEKTFRRVGGSTDIKMNARIIYATNRNLEEMVDRGDFRQDLYARISIVDLKMPSLKDRKEDIPYICQLITNDMEQESGQDFSFSDFPQNLKDHFSRDNIPFNIRGIKNELERLFIFCPLKENGKRDYSPWKNILITVGGKKSFSINDFEPIETLIRKVCERIVNQDNHLGLDDLLRLIERNAIEEAMRVVPANRKQAELLKIPESTLYTKKNRIFGYNHAEKI